MTDTIDIQTGKKKLIGIDKRFHTAPVFITPKLDETSSEFVVGDIRYKATKTKEGKDGDIDVFVMDDPKCPLKFSSNDSFQIGHTKEFDMSNPTDRFIYSVAMNSDFVARTKAEVNPQFHRYYVEDLETDALDEIKKADLFWEASNVIRSMASGEEKLDFARVVGAGNRKMSDNQVHASLMKLAKENPKVILDAWADGNRKVRQFLRKLVEAGTVTMKNSSYYYGKELVGVNEEFAVQYLKEPNNNAIVTQWNATLKKPSAEPVKE